MRDSAFFRTGTSIGDIVSLPTDVNLFTNNTTGNKYLKTGTLAAASLYPVAAKLKHLFALGTTTVTLPVSIIPTGWARNGSTIVITYGNTSVLVSTNDGLSFSTVASNLAGGSQATDVVYNPAVGRFILVGNDAINYYMSYSTTGSSFTTGATQVHSGSSVVSNTARCACDDNIVLMICNNTSALAFNVGRTTNGATAAAAGSVS